MLLENKMTDRSVQCCVFSIYGSLSHNLVKFFFLLPTRESRVTNNYFSTTIIRKLCFLSVLTCWDMGY